MKRLAILVFCLSVTSCQTASVQDRDLAVRVFDQLAYRAYPGGHPISSQLMLEAGYEKHRIYRWEQPIKVSFSGETADGSQTSLARNVMTRLAEIAGRELSFVGTEVDAANFRIEFVDADRLFINNAEFAACAARTRRTDNGQIDLAHIRIATKSKAPLERCLYHEALHGFGLAHTNMVPSVMNYATRVNNLTEWDVLILRTLYRDDFKPGMTRAVSLPLARRVMLSNEGE